MPASAPKKHSANVLKLAVAGAQGRMGRAVLAAAAKEPGWKVVSAWERPGAPSLGQDAGLAAGLPRLGVELGARPEVEGADVVVDFSAPSATLETLAAVLKSRRRPALVVGTTGFEAAQLAKVRRAARRTRLVLSSNYSVGMNLLWKAVEAVAKVTRETYDVEVVEAHHHHKKDSPSGTAMTTAEVLAKALGRELPVWARYGRPKGNIGARDPREIGLHTVRGGDIVGDHTVLFAGPGERLEFKHQAHSRENFARGALLAGRWLAQPGRKPGLYRMDQVLGLDGR